MKRRIRRLFLAATVVLLLTTLPLLALQAGADINGNCSATINGVDIGGLSSSDAGDAIEVKEHTAVPVTMQSAEGITHLRVQLEFAGFRWTVRDEPTSGTSWQNTVPVDKYAKYGVGLYKVVGQSDGPAGSCSGSALINVSGNPLKTVVGAAAAGITALGLVGLGVAGAASALETRSSTRPIEEWVTDELERTAQAEEQEEPEQVFPQFIPEPLRMCCFFAALPALLLTGMTMAAGGGPPPAAGPATRLPRAGWRPRISAVGLIGGLLAGAGIVVLLQQYALVYPTRAVAIEGLVGGLALGLIIPSLLRVFTVRRVNRALARAERRLNEAAAQQSPPTTEA
jgi:hypothetical protein